VNEAKHSITVARARPAAYDAVRSGAGVVARTDLGRIVLSGHDRRGYLQGLLTNDVAALSAGAGCYAAYLTAQGRMIADMYVYELGDVILMTTAAELKDTVLARLDQFIFSEDVQLGDVTDAFAQRTVLGPRAAAAVATAVGAAEEPVRGLAADGNIRASFQGAPAIVTAASDFGVAGFHVFVEQASAEALDAALAAAGATPVDAATAEVVRIEGGIPRFHHDMDEQTLPLEAGIETRAISFTKGCYVGQEIIIRVMHRGHGRVAKKLVGVLVAGDFAPQAGATIRSADRDVGVVTSAAISPALGRPIALGYVQRDFVEPGTALTIAGSAGTVTRLPFVDEPSN
jgi:folate-binding protein YgfZ